MKKFKKYIILLLCTISCISVNAQSSFIYLKRVIDNSNLEIYNKDNTKMGDIASSDKILWDILVSPKGNYISLIEIPKDMKKSTANNFKVFAENGKVIHSLDENVRRYEWSNNSNYIAMITGDYYEGGIGFSPEKVIIYDVKNKTKEVVNGRLNELGAYKIAWSPDDSRLYIKTLRNSAIFEYNITDKSLNLTELKDIYFSPDGKYFYQKRNPVINKEFAVYDASTNTKIELNVNLNAYLDNWAPFDHVEIIGWAPGKKHVFLYKHIIEDVEYEDHILPKKDPNDKNEAEWVLRDYKNRKVTKVIYKFYDVESNSIIKEFETNGVEHKLITCKNIIIYQEDGKSEFKEFKFQLAID